TFTADASAQVTIGGVTMTRATNGNSGPGGSGSATKSFVDANITISPNGVNEVNHSHTFNITVNALPGGSGLTASSFVITTSVSPAPGTQSSTCGTPTVVGNQAT